MYYREVIRCLSLSFILLFVVVSMPAIAGQTSVVDEIKKRDTLRCGVSGLHGFSAKGPNGEWHGIDVDYCKALASIVLGDSSKVEYIQLESAERFTALKENKIDILSRNSTWTYSRDTSLGISFVGVNFYDGQAFMVRKDIGVYSVNHLNGASVCVEQATTTYDNLLNYFTANNMQVNAKAFSTREAAKQGFFSGNCDAYTGDSSALASTRAVADVSDSYNYIILPELISKEPLGPAVRDGDDKWFDIARWTLYALIEAEELGITRSNVDQFKSNQSAYIKKLLGVTPGIGESLGLSDDWVYKIVKEFGNYGEIFDRNLGINSDLKLSRGFNNLWRNTGLMYSPPLK